MWLYLETLHKWAETYPSTRLIVIDLLAKIKPKAPQRGSVYDIEYQLIDTLVAVAKASKMPILLLHHTNQRSEEQLNDTFDSVGGSTGLLAPAAAVMKLRRKRHEKTLTLEVSGKGITEHKYTLERDDQWHIILKDAPPKPTISPERQAVIDLLKTHGKLSAKTIAEKLGKELGGIRKLLQRMKVNDLVKINGDDTWEVNWLTIPWED
jgi:hypothetical protein